MNPIPLEPNQLHRFYRGGGAIAALRGIESRDDHAPEDWVGATNAAFGTEDDGMSRLPDGRLLHEAVRSTPDAFLGAEHVAQFGADPCLLVKLLDAGERLPVHLHPGRRFARRHLGSAYGKTEAWVIIGARPNARVQVGFRESVDRQTLRSWVQAQDVRAMLGSLHELPVSAGDAVFVPAGTPHAIGEGILIVELQEPTDFSILLEVPEGEGIEPTLGLGWDVALQAVEREALSELQLRSRYSARRRVGRGVSSLLPDEAEPYFRAERVVPDPVAELDAGYSILVVVQGEGVLELQGEKRRLRQGETLLVPHSAGPAQVRGPIVAIRCRPGDPARAKEAAW